MKNGHGFVLVYSTIARSTFQEIPELYEQILRVKDRDSVPLVLVGNKCDLKDQREVEIETVQEFVKRAPCTFLEVSAKYKINVDRVFVELVRQISAGMEKKTKVIKKNHSKCILL